MYDPRGSGGKGCLYQFGGVRVLGPGSIDVVDEMWRQHEEDTYRPFEIRTILTATFIEVGICLDSRYAKQTAKEAHPVSYGAILFARRPYSATNISAEEGQRVKCDKLS